MASSVGTSFASGVAATTRQTPPRAGPPLAVRSSCGVEDIDADHAWAVASGWPLADPLQERPWGLTDFRLFDPSGQYLRISNAVPQDL